MNKIKKLCFVTILSFSVCIQSCSYIQRDGVKSAETDVSVNDETKDKSVALGALKPLVKRQSKNGPMAPVATSDYIEEKEMYQPQPVENFNTEEYSRIYENAFLDVKKNPLSTFSIDVDSASYSNIRRFINNKTIPPKDAVRIEEMINYFTYNYSEPTGKDPFSINTEISDCPWNKDAKLVKIGLQGKKMPTKNLPTSNLVFLIDVSGSMDSPDKLPLLKSAFKMLINQLRENDHVAIVVYAGAAGLVLPSTPGNKKEEIESALDKLQAGGSTAGGEGLKLAYKIAQENFIEEGNNRIILATDGDFNVGPSSDGEMIRLIEDERKQGTFLTVLGFGMGNYKDSKMEQIADKGNGNYAYIDNTAEAKKVLVSELGATLFTIAKDVKLQIEFNPAQVKAYRLIGYENRMLKNEDFNNDQKDAGELGAGHSVTALYEIVPQGKEISLPEVDKLKYQETNVKANSYHSKEIMTVKFRYKAPNSDVSKLIVKTIENKELKLNQTSDDFRFSAAVAGLGLLMRDSEYKGKITSEDIIALAKGAKGQDNEGYRDEFVRLAQEFNGLTHP